MQKVKTFFFALASYFRKAKSPMKKQLRRTFMRLISIIVFIASAAAFFYSLPLLTNCQTPIFLMTSKSMNPTYEQGDILLLSNRVKQFEIGDNVLIYIQRFKGVPLIHRIIAITDPGTPQQTFLTKGDKYVLDDMSTYDNMEWLKRDQIHGRVVFYIPAAGRIVYNSVTPFMKWVIGLTYLTVLLFIDKIDKLT